MNSDSSVPSVVAKVFFDQPYCAGHDAHSSHCLDLYVPEARGLVPLVIWIHGGGWAACDKGIDFAPVFLREGLAIASINYRLTSQGFPFPAQIEDCLSALAWLRAQGEELGIDTGKIGLCGHSAGAHLAVLTASACTTRNFSAGECLDVQAVVGWSGPYDLGRERACWPRNYHVWDPSDPFCTMFFPEHRYEEEFARWASPASYLRTGLPPMLLVHGGQDDIVPVGQAEAYARSASLLGTKATFRILPEVNHDFERVADFQEAAEFFKTVLTTS